MYFFNKLKKKPFAFGQDLNYVIEWFAVTHPATIVIQIYLNESRLNQ